MPPLRAPAAFEPSAALTTALAASGFVGTWERSPDGSLVLDASAAALVAGDAGLAGRPLGVGEATARLDPRGRDRFRDRMEALGRAGGGVHDLVRVRRPDGALRLLRVCGRVWPEAGGALRGAGTFFDVTAEEGTVEEGTVEEGTVEEGAAGDRMVRDGVAQGVVDGRVADGAGDGAGDGDAEDPLDRAAACALGAREAISRLGKPTLRLLVDMLLLEIGRELAGRVGRLRPRR